MLDAIVWIVSWAFILCGCVFVLSGAVGIIRMPDLYTRLHAASITDTGGAIFISIALVIQSLFVFGNTMAAIKVVLILFFTLFTAPTASHALAKTALLSGLIPTDKNGEPLLESAEQATQMARSRPADYQTGQEGKSFRKARNSFSATNSHTAENSVRRKR